MSTEATDRTAPRRVPIESLPPQAAAIGALLPPRAQSTGTLRRLQEAALIGFGERGYHGVSIRDLAAAVGVRVSSVYAHVSAKEDLLLELMVIGHDEHNELLRRALLASQPDPPAQMDALVRAHVRLHTGYPLLGRVCNKELHALSEGNKARVMATRLQSERMFLDVVSRGIESGQFRCADPWLAVAAIGGMGVRISEWFDPQGERSYEDVADAYADFAVKLLA